MLTSTSGMAYNAYHPLLTFDNLLSAADLEHIDQGDVAALGTAFTTWLQDKTEDFIIQVIDDWLTEKFENRTANNLLERPRIFTASPRLTDLQTKTGEIVGHRIQGPKERSTTTTLKRIGLRFNQPETFLLYLLKAGQVAPVNSWAVSYTGTGTEEWLDTNQVIEWDAEHFLAYSESDIAGQAINGVRDWALHRSGRTTFPTGKHLKIKAFSADVANATTLWDPRENVNTLSTNFGINMEMDVRCDYTEFILDQDHLFKQALGLGVAVKMLHLLSLNPNVMQNRNMSNIDLRDMTFEIMGDSQGKSGHTIHKQYKMALSALQFDTTGIGKDCLRVRRRGTTHKSIGPWAKSSYRY